MIQVTLLLSW